jgi:hypothetical protein
MPDNRADRASEVAAQRRRRDDLSGAPRLKLEIPEKVRTRLAAEGRAPRWINDTGNRIADLTTRDDYDKVEGVDPVKVGTDGDGKPIFAHLYSKPNEFVEEDRAKADERRRNVEASRFGGDKNPAQPAAGQMGAETYVDPATKIGRRNQVLE